MVKRNHGTMRGKGRDDLNGECMTPRRGKKSKAFLIGKKKNNLPCLLFNIDNMLYCAQIPSPCNENVYLRVPLVLYGKKLER